MATEKKGGTNIRYDDFVKQVKPDPGATDKIVLLHGYVGVSANEEKIRLYSDASLSEYADIPTADIVYSLPNNSDPLGGSSLWIKQSSTISYADASGFSQGDLYNSYMNNSYTPEAQAAPTAAPTITINQLTFNIVCTPTRFVCPTPVSRLVICTMPPVTRGFCPVPTQGPACPRPSWVDGCPSQWGCTFNTGTTVINPGAGTAQFANNYTGGDIYNDYMQNSYEPAYQTAAAGAGATSPQVCLQPATSTIICQRASSPILCRFTVPAWRCYSPITRTDVWCPVACAIGTIKIPVTVASLAGCPSDFCGPDLTATIQTVNPGGTIAYNAAAGRAAQAPADYAGGDIYNEYMQNNYLPGTQAYGTAAAITNPQICAQPISINFNCQSRLSCPSLLTICISRPVWRCQFTATIRSVYSPCIPTNTGTITTLPSAVDGCPSQFCPTDITTIRTGTINPGTGYGY